MNNFAPTPWKLAVYLNAIDVVDANGDLVAFITDRDIAGEGLPPANAEFVVRACNSHYDLLVALEAMVERAIPCAKHWKDDASIVAAHAAIAKAKGTK